MGARSRSHMNSSAGKSSGSAGGVSARTGTSSGGGVGSRGGGGGVSGRSFVGEALRPPAPPRRFAVVDAPGDLARTGDAPAGAAVPAAAAAAAGGPAKEPAGVAASPPGVASVGDAGSSFGFRVERVRRIFAVRSKLTRQHSEIEKIEWNQRAT